MGKPSILKSLLKRFLSPTHLYQIVNLQRNKKKTNRTQDDAQLKLYSQILQGDFLHYGYFDNPATEPGDISLNNIYKAQLRYAELIIDLISNRTLPVLDIGCGMGGLVKLLSDKNIPVIALTPDNTQSAYVSKKYSPVQLLHCRFEEMAVASFEKHFGTIITSESLQYLNLDVSLPIISKILRPGGQWIACDYFRTGDKAEKSGHYFSLFEKKLDEHGFKITFQKDITPNILPTIAYVYMWGTQIGMPVFEFVKEKLRTKNPGIYYGAEEALQIIHQKIDKNLDVVNPDIFRQNKKYMQLIIESK